MKGRTQRCLRCTHVHVWRCVIYHQIAIAVANTLRPTLKRFTAFGFQREWKVAGRLCCCEPLLISTHQHLNWFLLTVYRLIIADLLWQARTCSSLEIPHPTCISWSPVDSVRRCVSDQPSRSTQLNQISDTDFAQLALRPAPQCTVRSRWTVWPGHWAPAAPEAVVAPAGVSPMRALRLGWASVWERFRSWLTRRSTA